ncbi:GntR family transcriptional regulator [Rubneribacter badeniensis]|uniref:GntR family transcriptional regulator n=1 Tax=Rubneribacter badeniensis TaxID=2070688 RepID=A0A2K2U6Y0_9ACTN|nr:GntR family transcriptional regulator [Rubneribacter badeniensis]OUO95345.1 GntR family transcriptional regulator [Gordonibacter sp. An232A]PNV66095.1 GntR family transcriptional regulator [Rubneribacter badeniensis]CVH77941.1 HTH-type transcriptional repressor YtrA [Coriobacteriaceae bacterium CHKCI002]HJH43288.1 GntR family transcriptional regulator [Rubneribacter badeniensis]
MQNFNDIPGSDNGSGNGSSSGEGIRHDGSERGGNGSAGSDDAIVFRVDETSDLPIWAQLRNRIAYLIRTGRFKAGDQLPSVRSLAAEARINYNTVAKAYRDLELSGFIVSVRGRGMFVQKNVAASSAEEEAIDALVESCIKQYRARGMAYREVRERMTGIVDELERKAREAEEEKRDYATV